MGSLILSMIVFACVFGGALLGVFLRRLLPEHHMSPDSKDVVRLGMGLVATTLALVLGLLVASAKASYDTQSEELTQAAANVVLLDRLLAHYGAEAAGARAALRGAVARQIEHVWPRDLSSQLQFSPPTGEVLVDKIEELSPKDDNQRMLRTQTMGLAIQLAQTRWLIFEQQTVPIPRPLLLILLFWLVMLFVSFGLFAPANLTVLTSLFMSAMAVCGAIFLIVDLYYPYSGMIQISDAPLRAALAQLGH